MRSGGYNAYISTFAVFYSEQEVDNSKFVAMTKRFVSVKTYSDISKLKLDVVEHTTDSKTGVEIVELDVSNKKKVER